MLKQLKQTPSHVWSVACEHACARSPAAERSRARLYVLCYLGRIRAETPNALRRGFEARARNTKEKTFVWRSAPVDLSEQRQPGGWLPVTPGNAATCGCQKTPSSLLLLSAELGRCFSFVCVCSRLRIASLIPTTCIVSPNNAGAQNRDMNGTWPQLLWGNLDTAYLGVSFFLSFRRWCSSIIAVFAYVSFLKSWNLNRSEFVRNV